MNLPRLKGPIVLDGMSDEDAWRAVPRLPFSDARTLTMKYAHTFIF